MNKRSTMTLICLALALALAFALCGCTATQVQSETAPAAESGAAAEPADSQADTADDETPQLITVKVLDKTRESIAGTSFTDYWLETAYDYDDAGRLVGTSQGTNYPQSTLNLARGTFEYDDAGRLVKVSQAYEQYEWNVGNVEMFSYDEQGICTEYAYDVVSQGYGGTTLAYTYAADGRVANAVETDRGRPNIDVNTFDLVWSYADDGHVQKVIAGAGGEAGFGLVEELSDPARGTYAYRDVYDGLTTLKFNDDGTLASTTKRSANAKSVTQKTYEYKTITVDAATYAPTVYSNPTGLDPKWKPQVTLDEVPTTPAQAAS